MYSKGHNWQIRIRKCFSFDNPQKIFYVIDEIVTSTRQYITWQEIFNNANSAKDFVKKTIKYNLTEDQILIDGNDPKYPGKELY